MLLPKLDPTLKTGEEALHFRNQPLGIRLLDFWRWSVSDVLSNATRGILAEFIVASALGLNTTTRCREEWSAYDFVTEDGLKIEVKSSAYLQSWAQPAPSKILFGIRPTKDWDYDLGKHAAEQKRQAHVYVFCLLHHGDKQTVDPLNMDHWQFYVVPTEVLNARLPRQHSINLKTLQGLATPLCYDDLAGMLAQVAAQCLPSLK